LTSKFENFFFRGAPTGSLGARIEDMDLRLPSSSDDILAIPGAIGTYSVICSSGQSINPSQHEAYAARLTLSLLKMAPPREHSTSAV
jgi:hypothetical protein